MEMVSLKYEVVLGPHIIKVISLPCTKPSKCSIKAERNTFELIGGLGACVVAW